MAACVRTLPSEMPSLLAKPSPLSKNLSNTSNMASNVKSNKYFPRGKMALIKNHASRQQSLNSSRNNSGAPPPAVPKEQPKPTQSSHKKHHRRLQSDDLMLPPLVTSLDTATHPLLAVTTQRARTRSTEELESASADKSSPELILFSEHKKNLSIVDEIDGVDEDDGPDESSTPGRKAPEETEQGNAVDSSKDSPGSHGPHKRRSSLDDKNLGALLSSTKVDSLRSIPVVEVSSSPPKGSHRRRATLDVGAMQRIDVSTQHVESKTETSKIGGSDEGQELQALSDEVRRIKAKSRGKNDPKLAAAWSRLGNYHFKVASPQLAMECYHRALKAFGRGEDVLSGSREKSGDDTAFVAHTITKLGTLYWTMGQYESAVELLETLYRSMLELRGKDHVDTSNALHNLGQAHFLKGDLDAASRTLKEALESRKLARGHNHVDVARTMSVLGAVELRRGNSKEALRLFDKALTMKRWLLGGKHNSVVVSMLDVANARKACGQFESAIRMYTDALRVQRVLSCSDARMSRDIAMTLHARGNLYATVGNIKESIRSLKEAYLIYLEAGTPNDSSLMKSLKESLQAMEDVEENPGKENEAPLV